MMNWRVTMQKVETKDCTYYEITPEEESRLSYTSNLLNCSETGLDLSCLPDNIDLSTYLPKALRQCSEAQFLWKALIDEIKKETGFSEFWVNQVGIFKTEKDSKSILERRRGTC